MVFFKSGYGSVAIELIPKVALLVFLSCQSRELFLFYFCSFFLGYIFHFWGISCSQGNPLPQAFNDSTGSYMPNALGFTAILSKKGLRAVKCTFEK